MARQKNIAAMMLGKKGGKARKKALSKEQRQEIARKAGLASGKKRAEKAKNKTT